MRSRTGLVTAVVVLAIAGVGSSARGQGQNQAPRPAGTLSQELLRSWNSIHNRLLTMAKDFPEDKYDFKVQKDQRTFAENLLHIAGADYEDLYAVAGAKMGPDLGKDVENPSRDVYKTKADVVKLLQQATDDGAALIQKLGDSGLNETMKSPYANAMFHKSTVLWGDIEHCGEHYGQLVVYYRANNLVPPDSRPQPKQ